MSKAEASKAALDAARKSGYKGWIDQDGNKVKDLDAWIASKTGGKK